MSNIGNLLLDESFYSPNNPLFNNGTHKQHFSSVNVTLLQKRKMRSEKRWKELVGVKTGFFFSVWNLMNDVVSPGTVGMAQYVAQSGLVLSCVLFLVFGIITSYTLCILYDMAKKYGKKSLPDLAEYGFGKFGYVMTCIFIIIFNFGGTCAQLIMFGQVVPELLLYLYGEEHFLISRTAVLIYLTICMLPIAFLRDLGDFAIISFISVSCVLFIAFIVFYKALAGEKFNPPLPSDWDLVHPGALSALGGMSYIFVCHDLSFNVFTGLKKSNKVRYYSVVILTMIITIVTCVTIGVCGYLLFFDLNLSNANVLQLLPRSDILAIIGRIFLAVCIALSIPYSLFMPRLAFKFIVVSLWSSVKTNRTKDLILHYLLTLICVFSGLGVALIFTDLGAVFELTGGVSACSLAYIIPPLLMLKLEKNCCSINKVLSFFVLCLGIAIFCGRDRKSVV